VVARKARDPEVIASTRDSPFNQTGRKFLLRAGKRMLIVYILFRELEFGGIVALQRGRKGELSRSVIPIAPHIVIDRTRRNLPQPPEDLNAPEKEIWNTIMRQHNLNCVGLMFLESALFSLGRARICRDIINRDGELRRHPLLSIEVRGRQLARQIFKMLKIELRDDWV
jgi:hypothetical protein